MTAARTTSVWTADHVAAIRPDATNTIPVIQPADVVRAIPDLDLWDLWPVQLVDGRTADFDGASLWMILSAPILPDPDDRHDIARIRFALSKDGAWRDCGNVLPDGFCPGSREWAGTALYDPATNRLTLFWTASGRRGEPVRTFEQRFFQTTGTLRFVDGLAHVDDWTAPVECFASDDFHYVRVTGAEGKPGQIKGFRDPAHFRDPKDGRDYLFFTGSLKASQSEWNGVIGAARAEGSDHRVWKILPPLISADTLNNEMERPVMLYQDGLYYLFWSTQRKVFAPNGPNGPTGLYAMVAPSVLGPYEPVNGTGLVAGCPDAEPFQCYSWWVTHDLKVYGFTDLWGLGGQPIEDSADFRRQHFGATPAPLFSLELDGSSVTIKA